jgi:hypothetical protein
MNEKETPQPPPMPWGEGRRLARLPLPAKVLATSVLLTLALAMVGAVGQIIIHDIIPTFFADAQGGPGVEAPEGPGSARPPKRGDLFSDLTAKESAEPRAFYKDPQFVWTLKWSHIHLFGMNMIFILLGGVTLLLHLDAVTRAWLIALPFAGVVIDISAVWLKVFVSPHFFWLHLPGGGVFGGVFLVVFFRALWEMWWARPE